MIHYMPFTYIPDALIGQLTGQLGPLVVHMPMETAASESMKSALKAGSLQFRCREGINPVQLQQSANAFISWAELHGGKSGDLAGFFRAGQWQTGANVEPGTQQLRSLIRNWEHAASEKQINDPVFEAALFVLMAHRYDQQQDALDQDLGSVQSLETRFRHILGEPDAGGSVLPSDGNIQPTDPGRYMTHQRIQAWAQLAQGQIEKDSVLITTSQAVWDYILEAFPNTSLYRYPLELIKKEVFSEADPMGRQLKTRLLQFISASDPIGPTTNSGEQRHGVKPAEKGFFITFCLLKGCPPDHLLSWFLERKQDDDSFFAENAHEGDTVLGWVAAW